jgi:hypothetical protein
MATVQFNAGIDPGDATEYANRRNESEPIACQLFRFRLRQLMAAFVAISALFATLAEMQGMAGPVLLLAIIVLAAHVFATALGTRLRNQSDAEHAFADSTDLTHLAIPSAAERSARLVAVRSQVRSPWHARGTTALPWLRNAVLVAIAIGAIAGSSYLAVTIGYRASPAGILVGGLSVAVLCGWFAFLCGSFYGVFRHGFREAVAEPKHEVRISTSQS